LGDRTGLRPGTLRGRLAWAAVVTTAAWVVLLLVLFNLLLDQRSQADTDRLLRTRSEAAAATVRVGADGAVQVAEPPDDASLDSGIWIYQGTVALDRPQAGRRLQQAADRLASRGHGFTEIDGDRLRAQPVLDGNRLVATVVSAASLRPYRTIASTTLIGSAVLAVLLLAGVYAVSRSLIGRALRPVAQMSRQAADWSGHELHQRFGSGSRPAELRHLAASLDELLDRIALALRHERQLSAEISHEIRTPLARIVAETDWLRSQPGPYDAGQWAGLDAIAAAADQMTAICDTLLTEARTRETRLQGSCDLAAYARDLAERWPDVMVSIDPHLPPVGTDSAVLDRILTPLIDNARRYADEKITLSSTGPYRLAVEDDGPGIPEDLREAVFEPGTRLDPGDGHDGAGLGLPLARRLARAAEGELHLETGSRFVLALPPG
jgi:signal transduction histidine kinase